MKVLLAHSSEKLRRRAWEVLDGLGYVVLEADDVLDAERMCRLERPDVAVLEAALAWPEGGSLVDHLRSDPQLARLKLVVLDADLDLDRALAGLDQGVDEYLREPLSEPELAVRIVQAQRSLDLEDRLRDQQAELRDLLHADPLTGLLDRRYIANRLSAQVNEVRRAPRPLSVLLVDVDHFKQTNDTLGHAAGDEVLRAVADLLCRRLRDGDWIGRWGGDEFLAVLPNATGEAALGVARELVAAARALDGPAPVTLSVGCAQWDDDDPAGLVERADLALYEVKRAGRDDAALAPARVVAITTDVAPDPAPVSPTLRVMIVDDVDSIRELLRLMLAAPGVEVVAEAADGASALEVALDKRPDVVVMDWNMPGMDGIQATRRILGAVPGLTVVAFTSTEDRRIHRAMLDAGAAAHFNKADLGNLVAFVHALGRKEPSAGGTPRTGRRPPPAR